MFPTGWAGKPQFFDAAFFWHARIFGADKPQLPRKMLKALQMTHKR